MKNSARKILALVLTLVLICALATAAFAATTRAVDEETSGGSTVSEYASIDTCSVYGQVYVNDGERMNSLRVSITYTYQQTSAANSLKTLTHTTTGYDVRSHEGSVTLTSSECYKMKYAYYNFRAEIPSEGTFYSTPIQLTY